MKPLTTLEEIPPLYRERAALVMQAIRKGKSLKISYQKGSTPGQTRTITPALLFQKIDDNMVSTGAIYLMAHCHLRHHSRTFRLDALVIKTDSNIV